MSDLRASRRLGLVRKVKLWLRRSSTFKIAVFILNIFSLIVRIIDLIK